MEIKRLSVDEIPLPVRRGPRIWAEVYALADTLKPGEAIEIPVPEGRKASHLVATLTSRNSQRAKRKGLRPCGWHVALRGDRVFIFRPREEA